jgi:hypothetical protein
VIWDSRSQGIASSSHLILPITDTGKCVAWGWAVVPARRAVIPSLARDLALNVLAPVGLAFFSALVTYHCPCLGSPSSFPAPAFLLATHHSSLVTVLIFSSDSADYRYGEVCHMGFGRRPRRAVIPSLARDLALNVFAPVGFAVSCHSPLVTRHCPHHSSLPASTQFLALSEGRGWAAAGAFTSRSGPGEGAFACRARRACRSRKASDLPDSFAPRCRPFLVFKSHKSLFFCLKTVISPRITAQNCKPGCKTA